MTLIEVNSLKNKTYEELAQNDEIGKNLHLQNAEKLYLEVISVDENNLIESKNNTEVIKYNFDTNLFEYIGKLNFHFDQIKSMVTY